MTTPNATWTAAQQRAAIPGSPILTNWRAEREAARAKPVQNVEYSQEVMDAFGVMPTASGVAVTAASAMRVAAVFACVQKIAGAIATLPLHIQDRRRHQSPPAARRPVVQAERTTAYGFHGCITLGGRQHRPAAARRCLHIDHPKQLQPHQLAVAAAMGFCVPHASSRW